MNMGNGSTTIGCGQVFRLYDDGGANGNYEAGTSSRHTFTTTDGKPATIHFEELSLSETSHLFVITGTELNVDSVLYDLTAGSENPGVISSNGNTLTLYFLPGMKPAAGWNAIVEHSPGMSVADVWRRNEVTIRDEVCQSQTNTYDDPYGVSPDVVPLEVLNRNLRRAGTYTYTQTLYGADSHGCDSTVTFVLTVNPPMHHDTTVVTTNIILSEQGPFVWSVDGRSYTITGRYSKRYAMADGCDSLAILDFIVLQVDTTDNEICKDETTRLGVTVTTPDMSQFETDLLPPAIAIGDVLCDDGSVLKVDSFLISDKVAKGVVFYVDKTGMHGLAVALKNATNSCEWGARYSGVFSLTKTNLWSVAIFDMNGYGNTLEIKRRAENSTMNAHSFARNAPAAYYCYYYDHITNATGTQHKGWYLPAAGELNVLFGNRILVNKTLNDIGGYRLTNSKYFSSTSDNQYSDTGWDIDATGYCHSFGDVYKPARAIVSF